MNHDDAIYYDENNGDEYDDVDIVFKVELTKLIRTPM